MDSVIRSARISKQPHVLGRKRDERGTSHAELSTDVPVSDGASIAASGSEEAFGHETTPTATSNASQATAAPGVDVGAGAQEGAIPEDQAGESPRHDLLVELQAQHEEELRVAKERAIEAGRQEGYQAGHAEALEEYSKQLSLLADIVGSARQALEEGVGGLADTVVELTFEATAKILGRAMVQRDGVVTVVRELLNRAKTAEKLMIRVSPQDYPLLEAARDDLLAGFEKAEVDIVADDRVTLGGCLLETPSGNLDGRLEIQLQHFVDTLLAAKARWPEPDLEAFR